MIEVKNLSKFYGNNEVLKQISFSVSQGEIVGFLGANGAGKSTAMNIIAGFLTESSGEVIVCGLSVKDHPKEIKQKIGYLPEQPPLYPDLTVTEYLEYIFDVKKCKIDKRDHIDDICGRVDIQDVKHRIIKNLSKGYRQRVGIAGALVGNPEILILDEPTVGLDPRQIIDIRNLIKNIGKDKTVILSSHIMQEVQAVCDRILVIHEGKIVLDSKAEKLLSGVHTKQFLINAEGSGMLEFFKELPIVEKVKPKAEAEFYITLSEGAIPSDLSKAVIEKGYCLNSFAPYNESLEEIFLKLIEKR